MTATSETDRARRYLLGDASDEECQQIEQDYLEHDEAVDRIAAAEDDLIEDYLSERLNPSERDRFEQAYLSAPHHRIRVETIRRLTAQASRIGTAHPKKARVLSWTRVRHHGPWLALAASLLVVASIAFWRFAPFGTRPAEIVERQTPPPAVAPQEQTTSTPPSVPRLFAVTISPAAVRGGAEQANIVIPAGTDSVVIRFESDVNDRGLTARRASIQTVAGGALWQGPVTTESDPPPGTVARIDVPAATLPPDDYLVTLYGTDQRGVEREWTRYFLSIRAR